MFREIGLSEDEFNPDGQSAGCRRANAGCRKLPSNSADSGSAPIAEKLSRRGFTIVTVGRMLDLRDRIGVDQIAPTEAYPSAEAVATAVGLGAGAPRKPMTLSDWLAFMERVPRSNRESLAFSFNLTAGAIDKLKTVAHDLASRPSKQHDPGRRSAAFLKTQKTGKRRYRTQQIDGFAPALSSHECEVADADRVFESLMKAQARGEIGWPLLDRILSMTNRSNSEIRMHDWEDIQGLARFLCAAGIPAARCSLVLVSLPSPDDFVSVSKRVCSELGVTSEQISKQTPFRRCSNKKEFGVITAKLMATARHKRRFEAEPLSRARAASGWKRALFVARVVTEVLADSDKGLPELV